VYQLRILDSAVRELADLDRTEASRIAKRLRWLAENLEQIPLQALQGDLAGLYKLRVGDYRVIYEILSPENTLVIHAIGHRRDVYRKR
jgi:mRNA interferase RelE/StbE